MEEYTLPMERGRLRCRREGARVRLTMEAVPGGRGLYRGEIFGRGGSLDLGILLPQGGGLRLERSLSVRTLEARDCWPILGGRLLLSHSFVREEGLPGWERREALDGLFPGDPALAREAAGLAAWYREEAEGGFSLAFPWEGVFPLTPVFCFARRACLHGRWYLVYRFGEDGRPVMPEEGEPT